MMRMALCGLLLVSAAIGPAAAEPRRVVLVHPSSYALSPWSNMATIFRAELVRRSPDPLDIHDVSFDYARFQDRAQDEGIFVEYLRALFADRKVDLVVPVGAPAAQFLQRHRAQLFASVPMLIMGAAAGRIPASSLAATDVSVETEVDLPEHIENILRLVPAAKEILVASGQSPNERYWLAELRRHSQPFEGRVKFIWLDDLPFEDVLKRAAAPPSGSALFLFLMLVDARGVPYAEDRALDLLRAVARAPIFGTGDFQVGRGIVGGPVVPTERIGQQAATAAIRILSGESPGAIKVPAVEVRSTYDWRELRRWDIAESLLPPGSIVRFREPTTWQQYRWQIALAVFAIALQSALITALLYQRRRRRSAEVEARRRMAELALVNRRAAIGEMSASIAHEIKQPLSAIVTNSDVGKHWLAKLAPSSTVDEASAALKRIVNDAYRANKVVDSVRAMFKKDDEGRALLDVNDVIREVLTLLRIELEEHDVAVKTALSDGPARVLANRIQLQQVVLNLARNAIEAMDTVNGRPRVLKLGSAATDSGEFFVTIEDTGPGIDPDILNRLFEPFVTTKSSGMGMGLSICRSIVEAHGGRLSAAGRNPHGAVFEVVLPRQ
jgi:signal transduction histidine kinase